MRRVECICRLCGRRYLRWPSEADRSRTCGRRCPGLTVARTCLRCGVSFRIKAAHFANGRGQYCSVACHHPPGDIWTRIERRTDRSGDCHLWTGAVTGPGYPEITFEQKSYRLHRLVLERKLGRPIAPGMMACHQCEHLYPPGDISYRRCINPDHLEEGDKRRNAADMQEAIERRRSIS